MIIEVSTTTGGPVNTGHFVRGEFEYVPDAQDCSMEVVAISVPECP